mgnify:CR=1 FL=1
MEHTDKSIQEANNKIREGTYLVGEFESDGDFVSEGSFGGFWSMTKEDIKVLYEASLLLEVDDEK